MNEPILSVIGLLAVVLLVLAGAYAFTRWAGRSLGGGLMAGLGGGRRLQVLDRAGLGKDQTLLVVRAGQRYLLLGSTPAGLTLLAELSQEEAQELYAPSPGQPAPPTFGEALRTVLKQKKPR